MSDMPGSSTPPPPPPVPPTAVPAPDPSFSTAETTGLPPNIAAGLASLLSLVGGIIFLILEKRDPFVRFYAMQSTILGAIALGFSVALQIAIALLHFIPLLGTLIAVLLGLVGMLVGLAFFLAWIVMVLRAFSGKEWEVPYIRKIARAQLARPPL